MRSTFSSTVLRDVSRVCARCRHEATRRASFVSRPSPSIASSSSSSTYSATVSSSSFSSTSSPAQSKPSSSKKPATKRPSSFSSSHKPLPAQTFYDLFPESLPAGPPPSGPFPIDARSVRREFLQLQARAHPDMHPTADKARAEATSAHINHAYKTLTNPLLRAQYLLSLRGVDVADDERLQVRDPELLDMAMEAHEEILEAEREEDIEVAKGRNEVRLRECEASLDSAFKDDDLDRAMEEAVRLRYLVNIQEALDNWELGKPAVLAH